MLRNALSPLALIALVAMLAAPSIPSASAGDYVPIFEDGIVASVTVGDNVYIAIQSRKTELEQKYMAQATEQTLGATIAQAPAATSANEIVMYGCYAAGQAATDLENKGFDTRSDVASSFAGASLKGKYKD